MENPAVPAARVMLGDLLAGRQSQSADNLQVVDRFARRVSCVNVVGTVVDRFVNADGSYMSLTIDDGSGAIRAKFFRDGVRANSEIKIGDDIAVIGGLRSYNGELYISPDTVRRVEDANLVTLRKLELLRDTVRMEKAVESIRQVARKEGMEAAEKYASDNFGVGGGDMAGMLDGGVEKTISSEDTVMKVMKDFDSGDGVALETILSESGLDENRIDSAVTKLLDDGTIFEPRVGRFKIIG